MRALAKQHGSTLLDLRGALRHRSTMLTQRLVRSLVVTGVTGSLACSLLLDPGDLGRTGAQGPDAEVATDVSVVDAPRDVFSAVDAMGPGDATPDADESGEPALARPSRTCATPVTQQDVEGRYPGWALAEYTGAQATGALFPQYRCGDVLRLEARFDNPLRVTDAPAQVLRRNSPITQDATLSYVMESAVVSDGGSFAGVQAILAGAGYFTTQRPDGTLVLERFVAAGMPSVVGTLGRPIAPYRVTWRWRRVGALLETEITAVDRLRTYRLVRADNTDGQLRVQFGLNGLDGARQHTLTVSELTLP
jgi:hypothetical protein